MCGLFVPFVIPPRSFQQAVVNHPELSSCKVSFSVPSFGKRALKANFVLWRHFSFSRRGLFQLSACFTDHPLVICPRGWEQQMWNGRARWWKWSGSARRPWERCGIVDLAEHFCLWVTCGPRPVWFHFSGRFLRLLFDARSQSIQYNAITDSVRTCLLHVGLYDKALLMMPVSFGGGCLNKCRSSAHNRRRGKILAPAERCRQPFLVKLAINWAS